MKLREQCTCSLEVGVYLVCLKSGEQAEVSKEWLHAAKWTVNTSLFFVIDITFCYNAVDKGICFPETIF